MKNYEAMFVLDTGAKPLEAFQEEIRQLVERHGGKVLKAEKWTERKLVYPIARRKRGTYYIVFFEAPTSAVAPIEKEVGMKREAYLRLLILDNPLGKDAKIPTPPEEGDRVGVFKPDGMFRPDREASAGAAH